MPKSSEFSDYGFKLVYPDRAALTAAGFGKVAHIPAIFDSRPGYARLPSRFLMDRALCVWDPKNRGARPSFRTPSTKSIKNYGDWLCNALEWAEVRGVDLMTCDYVTVLVNRYQLEMTKGIWSESGEPLSAGTFNPRVGIALEFQMWCADKGYREQFLIPTETRSYWTGSHDNSKGHEAKIVEVRKGKVKVNKRKLVFPTREVIDEWRKRLYDRPVVGSTHGLMADHILQTGIRREELSCWRVDTLPLEREEWKIVNPEQPEEFQQVSVTFGHGAKGEEFYIDEYGDKMGPQGTIKMPLSLCKRIDDYRNNERAFALKHITKGVRNIRQIQQLIDKTLHLYLDPVTGQRYSGDQIYRSWKAVKGPNHWSPHLGRDWWACQILWQAMQEHAALIKQLHSVTNLKADHPLWLALQDTALTTIRLEIQPQLRHASSATTENYLQWLFNQVSVPLNLTRKWQEYGEET